MKHLKGLWNDTNVIKREADSKRRKNSMSGYNTTQLWTAKL